MIEGRGRGTGLCFMEEQTVIQESRLHDCVYLIFLAVFLKLYKVTTKNVYRKKDWNEIH